MMFQHREIQKFSLSENDSEVAIGARFVFEFSNLCAPFQESAYRSFCRELNSLQEAIESFFVILKAAAKRTIYEKNEQKSSKKIFVRFFFW